MQSFTRFVTALVVAGFPALALAHPDHGHATGAGLFAGLVHPLTGVDHVIAAVVLATAIALAARFSLRHRAWVALGAAGMAAIHAGVHALVPPVSASFAAGVAASTAAIYAVAAGAGLFVASRRRQLARVRR